MTSKISLLQTDLLEIKIMVIIPIDRNFTPKQGDSLVRESLKQVLIDKKLHPLSSPKVRWKLNDTKTELRYEAEMQNRPLFNLKKVEGFTIERPSLPEIDQVTVDKSYQEVLKLDPNLAKINAKQFKQNLKNEIKNHCQFQITDFMYEQVATQLLKHNPIPTSDKYKTKLTQEIHLGLLVSALAEKNKISCTEQDYNIFLKDRSLRTKKTVDEIKSMYATEEKQKIFKSEVLIQKVLNEVLRQSKIVDLKKQQAA